MAGSSPEPTADSSAVERPTPELTVAFALVKGHKPELVVQKLTELGMDRIVAFEAARSVVRWSADKATTNRDRWQRVAREAAMQSRRLWVPTVEPISSFVEVASRPGACRAQVGGGRLELGQLVMVGPEGGWDSAELDVDIPDVSLGDGVLRAETAAIAVGTLLSALRFGLIEAGSG